MFAYCTEVLHLSEAAAYLRIAAARASREHPMLLEMLADGRLHLSGIARLAPHLTRENAEGLLKRAVHKSKRQIEELIAELVPRPDVPAVMRKVPTRRGQAQPTVGSSGAGAVALDDTRDAGSLALGPYVIEPSIELRPERVAPSQEETGLERAVINHTSLRPNGGSASPAIQDGKNPSPVVSPGPRAVVQPLSPGRYRVQFTASAELHHKLERLRALMRTKVPDGDLAAIIEEAVTEKLERLEARRFAATKNPRTGLSKTDTSPSSRRIPAAVKRAVWKRDGGRCRYVNEQGRRCTERHRLEYHHTHPFALGGDHDPGGIRLLCRVHNLYLAERDYGRQAIARYRRSANPVFETMATPLPRTAGAACSRGPIATP